MTQPRGTALMQYAASSQTLPMAVANVGNSIFTPQPEHQLALAPCGLVIWPQVQYHRSTRHTGATTFPRVLFQGFCLQRAMEDDFDGLANGHAAAFAEWAELPQKMSVVLQFVGFARYSRQVNVLRVRQTPPTRSQLAKLIAREVSRFLEDARSRNTPLHFGGLAIRGLEDLSLVDARHVPKSTLQPTIAIIPRC
ncbi:hypothetical protein C8Q77DRAFT_772772 [Trametes polyzona]|nr:hypothetical protein C8Q77DRAFT_772772 [Trametes polyzona]